MREIQKYRLPILTNAPKRFRDSSKPHFVLIGEPLAGNHFVCLSIGEHLAGILFVCLSVGKLFAGNLNPE
ncbi:MAG: hypothetical protein ACFNJR_01970 [Segatella oulorum]|uniref:hypothetical protein n=1 Tax=Segatella oulorum TaxID=28136 RepID=UPI00360A06D7